MVAALLAGGGFYLWSPTRLVERRLHRVAVAGGALDRAWPGGSAPLPRRWRTSSAWRHGLVPAPLVAGMTGLVATVMAGSLAFGAAAGALVWLWRSAARARIGRRKASLAAAVAPCADLLAACLAAGASAEDAIASVASSIEGPLREHLLRVSAALRAGADVSQAWQLADDIELFAPLARAFARAARSGAPLAATVGAVADEQRRARRWAAEAAARRAGVLAVAPLVICFLPAFVLVGVVPAVAGVATRMLTDF